MDFDRAVIDEEFAGDFPAGFLIGDHLQDAAFGRRQRVEMRKATRVDLLMALRHELFYRRMLLRFLPG